MGPHSGFAETDPVRYNARHIAQPLKATKQAPMAKPVSNRPAARVPRGFRDIGAAEIRAETRMLNVIRTVYEAYGFEPLDTPAIEFTDALGKFLPDQDRPNEGVFSFADEDRQWLSLRYDLTAPLARYVAESFDRLPKPFRRYAVGPVWRNEKPGPGRYRQFTQFDADTVGTDNVAADAEICMLAADTLERLGIARGDYQIKVNNRKILDGLLASIGVDAADTTTRLAVLRSLDKLDKFAFADVALLLGPGRKDESGDFTKGAGLERAQIDGIERFLASARIAADAHYPAAFAAYSTSKADTTYQDIQGAFAALGASALLSEGLAEVETMHRLFSAAGYGPDRIVVDPSVVRGLDYYTGPVFEAELTFATTNENGETVRFGSVGGGGRYDDLVARFTGQKVPATGFSIGVSRLAAALRGLDRLSPEAADGPVVVLVMDKDQLPRYQRLVQTLREAQIRAEMYLGSAGMKAQMKYADRRGAPCVVIQGSQERDAGEVQIKDLVEGTKASRTITEAKAWRELRPAQFSVPETELVAAVEGVLARQRRT